jgi:putative FmdB family regulatory protein
MEAIQKISDDPLTDCPECSQGELKKLVSAAGFRLKGGGWYETDFKSGKKKNLVQDAGTGSGSGTKSSSDSSTNKSDTKASGSGDKKSS